MARICGVCKQPPREGQEMRPIRLAEDDLQHWDTVTETGLYSSCLDCVEVHRKRVAEKLSLSVDQVTNNMMC